MVEQGSENKTVRTASVEMESYEAPKLEFLGTWHDMTRVTGGTGSGGADTGDFD
ncbi:hypothetical protein DES52_10220 [Deinococcus yavapaiensis KR-236]|uniref:Uncharacterized protein n=1 Tax=Deinococcus yavapaiensis KR-236 TaxID=694435 RepID=A0A318SRF5_9DEIO|nr:hypothetical protein DES52_10220 [Deinococcus yavapaiensis KR-236]